MNGPKVTDPMNDGDLVAAGRTAPEEANGDCADPLGSLSSGRLLFVWRLQRPHTGSSMENLYRARGFRVPGITVRVQGHRRRPKSTLVSRPSISITTGSSVAPRSRSMPLSLGTSRSVVAPLGSPQT